jgi:hypothetical protein
LVRVNKERNKHPESQSQTFYVNFETTVLGGDGANRLVGASFLR